MAWRGCRFLAASVAAVIGVQVSSLRETHATVDLTGLWHMDLVLHYSIGDSLAECFATIVQTGTNLVLSGPCNGFLTDLSFAGGTIDPDTGIFSGTIIQLPDFFLYFQGTGSATGFSGTLELQPTPFFVTGSFGGQQCGDGQIDPGETCDDADSSSGDGCGAACQVETCYTCSGEPSVCTPDVGAACDDGDPCTSGETCNGSSVCTGGSDVCLLDHYKCYAGKDLRNPPFMSLENVSLSDQLSGSSYGELVRVTKLKFVCTPVDKNGEGIANPSGHLSCYQIKAADLSTLNVRYEVSTQFQTSQFGVKKGKLLCLPSTKTIIP